MLGRLLQVKRLTGRDRDEILSLPEAGPSASDNGPGQGVEPVTSDRGNVEVGLSGRRPQSGSGEVGLRGELEQVSPVGNEIIGNRGTRIRRI